MKVLENTEEKYVVEYDNEEFMFLQQIIFKQAKDVMEPLLDVLNGDSNDE